MSDSTARSSFNWLCVTFYSIVVLIAATNLLGWFFSIDPMRLAFSGVVTMKVNTAIALLCLSGALLLRRRVDIENSLHTDVATTGLYYAIAGLALLIGGLSLIENLFPINFRIDELLVGEKIVDPLTTVPGRMSLFAAVNIILLALALLNRTTNTFVLAILQFFVFIVLTISAINLVGYLFEVPDFHGLMHGTHIAFSTAFCFLLLSLGIFLSFRQMAVNRVLLSPSPGGMLARRILPIVILLPIILGWLRLRGQQAGLYDVGSGVFLMILATILILATLIWRAIVILERLQQQRDGAEAEALRSRQFIAGIIEGTEEMIAASDRDFRMVAVNDAYKQEFRRIFGAGIDVGDNLLEALKHLPEEQRAMKELWSDPLQGKRTRLEHEFGDPGRERNYYDIFYNPVLDPGGNIIGASHFKRNITERKKLELAMCESEERFRSCFNNQLDGFAILQAVRAGNGTITDFIHQFINDAGCRMYMMTREAVVGKGILEIRPSHKDSGLFEEYVRVTETGASLQKNMFVFEETYADERLSLAFDIQAIRLGDGVAVTWRDVTEHKRTEDLLSRHASELAQSNAELQNFAYVASHDLQEPLRKIQAFGDLLVEQCGAAMPPEARDYVSRMQKASVRLSRLINDLLSFSRLNTQARPFERTDLRTLLDEVRSDLEIPIAERNAVIEIGDLPVIDADPVQMRRLFQNLFSNSLKFQPGGQAPRIRIRSEIFTTPPTGRLDLKNEQWVRIFVADNGIGFDEKYLDRIFAIFQRLHLRTEYEGSGIGLAVCRKIVDRHRGAITAQSAPGNGATFIITLPIEHPSRTLTT